MTGLEPFAAAAGGVAKAAAKAERGDPEERKVLRELARDSGALDPAARLHAKRVAVKELVWLKLWQPFGRALGISKEYFDNGFANDMADRLENIPAEHLTTPPMYVAGPAVQGIAFTADEPDLRAMYLNLLAAASDARRAGAAHPSFAEIIRQLSPEEAVLLKEVLSYPAHPIVELRAKPDADPANFGRVMVATHIMNWQVDAPGRALQIGNWIRLGLVAVDYAESLTLDSQYDWVEGSPQVLELRAQWDTEEFERLEVTRGVLRVTDFGRTFHGAVMQPGNGP